MQDKAQYGAKKCSRDNAGGKSASSPTRTQAEGRGQNLGKEKYDQYCKRSIFKVASENKLNPSVTEAEDLGIENCYLPDNKAANGRLHIYRETAHSQEGKMNCVEYSNVEPSSQPCNQPYGKIYENRAEVGKQEGAGHCCEERLIVELETENCVSYHGSDNGRY